MLMTVCMVLIDTLEASSELYLKSKGIMDVRGFK